MEWILILIQKAIKIEYHFRIRNDLSFYIALTLH